MITKNKLFYTVVLVMLSTRVGDLIALLIIAKESQCKGVHVPETVQIGS